LSPVELGLVRVEGLPMNGFLRIRFLGYKKLKTLLMLMLVGDVEPSSFKLMVVRYALNELD